MQLKGGERNDDVLFVDRLHILSCKGFERSVEHTDQGHNPGRQLGRVSYRSAVPRSSIAEKQRTSLEQSVFFI